MATQKRFLVKNGLDNNSQTITNVATPVNTTDAVTKAYADLKPALSSTTPAALGVAAVGTGTTAARADHVHTLPSLATLGAQAAGSYVTVGGALGTPSSGTLTNCTFPTLNQNTTGTASNITAYTINQNVGTANTVQHSDITTARAAALTTGYVYYGNTATKYAGFDGTNFVTSMPMSFNILGSSASCTGNAATATTATRIAGGVANNVPYQTAAGTTAFVPVSTAAGQVLTTVAAGGAPTWVTPTASSGSGFTNIQVYTTTTTWTIPAGVTKCKVTVVAGGGGGAGGANSAGGGAGGAGGTAIKYVTGLVPAGTVVCTVGTGGAAGGAAGAGGTGVASSFGANCSATGGAGGSSTNTMGGLGGLGASGSINIYGASGHQASRDTDGCNFSITGGNGGSTPYGSGGIGGQAITSATPSAGSAGRGYGAGGGGGGAGIQGNAAGGAGSAGIIIIEY